MDKEAKMKILKDIFDVQDQDLEKEEKKKERKRRSDKGKKMMNQEEKEAFKERLRQGKLKKANKSTLKEESLEKPQSPAIQQQPPAIQQPKKNEFDIDKYTQNLFLQISELVDLKTKNNSIKQPPVAIQQSPVAIQQPPVAIQQSPVAIQQPPVAIQQSPAIRQPEITPEVKPETPKFQLPSHLRLIW